MFSNYQNLNEPSVSMRSKSSMPMELIKFLNVKPKYYLNDDILLEYVLDHKFQPSYRDFIGLYPRGWNDLVQYVTFEWILTRPNEVSPRRSVLFRCRYHSQVVHTDRDYQFVYINYKIEVMGRSQYFRFLPAANPIGNSKKSMQRVSSDVALTPSVSIHPDSLTQTVVSPKPSSSNTKMDGHQKPILLVQPQEQMHLRGFSSETTLTSTELPSFCSLTTPNMKSAPCSFCNHQSEISYEHQKFENKAKSSATWVHNLEDRNHSLEERIQDLESELEMSLVTQKRLRLAAHHSKREKMAYQKFVNELINALSQKGIARVIDGQGTEMLVKRIPDTISHADSLEERPLQIGGKTSRRERFLKAVIGSQEQKIRDLMLHLDATTKACCNLSMKMDLVAISKDDEEDNGNSNNMNPTKQTPKSVIAVVPKGQGDSVVELPESERPQQSSKKQSEGNKTEITDDLLLRSKSCEGVENMNKHNENDVVIRQESTDLEDDTSNPIADITSDRCKTPVNTRSIEKPSAVVLECESAKYAVIRY